ncbi:hypothetical protein Tco_1466497 [Tanacetum coccineum]
MVLVKGMQGFFLRRRFLSATLLLGRIEGIKSRKEDISPPVRVFRRGLPEWTLDLTNYLPKHFPQQECAISCDLHGYLALPVFDLTTRSCVGVIELLTSSKYVSYAHEVQQFHSALKVKVWHDPQPTLPLLTLKASTAKWEFRGSIEQKQHLNSHPKGLFWASSSISRNLCFCRDVTILNAEEYSLVHYARMVNLASCFAIYLQSLENGDDYVLEFFLPPGMEDGRCVQDVVETLRQRISSKVNSRI